MREFTKTQVVVVNRSTIAVSAYFGTFLRYFGFHLLNTPIEMVYSRAICYFSKKGVVNHPPPKWYIVGGVAQWKRECSSKLSYWHSTNPASPGLYAVGSHIFNLIPLIDLFADYGMKVEFDKNTIFCQILPIQLRP